MKYVKVGGRCPIDDWLDSRQMTTGDVAKLDAKVIDTHRISGDQLPPERVKKYQSSRVSEFKAKGDRKQLRPLCKILEGKRIVLLCGSIEKGGKIPAGDIERAENLLDELERRHGNLKPYFHDSNTMEEIDE